MRAARAWGVASRSTPSARTARAWGGRFRRGTQPMCWRWRRSRSCRPASGERARRLREPAGWTMGGRAIENRRCARHCVYDARAPLRLGVAKCCHRNESPAVARHHAGREVQPRAGQLAKTFTMPKVRTPVVKPPDSSHSVSVKAPQRARSRAKYRLSSLVLAHGHEEGTRSLPP